MSTYSKTFGIFYRKSSIGREIVTSNRSGYANELIQLELILNYFDFMLITHEYNMDMLFSMENWIKFSLSERRYTSIFIGMFLSSFL